MVAERRAEKYTRGAQMKVCGKRDDAKEKEFHTKGLKRFFCCRTVGGAFLTLDKNLIHCFLIFLIIWFVNVESSTFSMSLNISATSLDSFLKYIRNKYFCSLPVGFSLIIKNYMTDNSIHCQKLDFC